MRRLVKRFQNISDLWNDTQGYLKFAEDELKGPYVPAINELRYSARLLLDVWMVCLEKGTDTKLTAKEKRELEDKLTVAAQYLENAHHDITDEIRNNIRYSIAEWEELHGAAVFQSVTAMRQNLLSNLQVAKGKVVQSRRARSEREKLYVELRENDIPALLKEFKDLEKCLIENVANILDRDIEVSGLTDQVSGLNQKIESMSKTMRFRSGLAIFFGLTSFALGVLKFFPFGQS